MEKEYIVDCFTCEIKDSCMQDLCDKDKCKHGCHPFRRPESYRLVGSIPEYEERLDQIFLLAFDTNHAAMHDWAQVKMELKRLRKQRQG
jgi:hypothetical protein